MENENGRGLTGLDGSQEEGEGLSPQATGYQTALEQSPRSRAFSLAQMLVDAGILPSDEVAKAQETAWRERLPLGRILVRDGLVLSRDLATLTALNLGLAMVDLRSQTIEREAVRQIPEDVARRYMVLPVSKQGDHLTVAMTDPTDLQVIQDLAARTGCTIEPVITTDEDIKEHVDRAYRLTAQPMADETGADGQGPVERVTARHLRDAQPAEVIELLLQQALQDRDSDIHIEPSGNRLRIRFRIDGILHEVMNLPLEMHPTIISRLKIMSGLNIAERRRPQDGQLNFESADQTIDVRVAISGTVTGEMAVLRLLDKEKFTLVSNQQKWDTLGAERSGAGWRSGELPEGPVVASSPFGGLSLHLLPAL